DERADRLHLGAWHHGPLIPALSENGHEASRLADLDIGPLVERVMQEEIAGKQRDAARPPYRTPSGPDFYRRQEHLEPLAGKLPATPLQGRHRSHDQSPRQGTPARFVGRPIV